ncbi:MAG TPA: FAD-binding protein, partial [Gaiellaceae bacterium]|nr:FAD-binding protein [Gaiellaceae bacterium]
MRIERDVRLSRHTTLGTGGPARALARPGSVDDLLEALAWARAEGLEVVVIGLGSNLLVADEGVDALVLRLAGDLAATEVDGDRIRAGGGATNAVVLHRARDTGLGGFEFACAIPGTIGGGVKMNAGAYGGDFAQVVVEALVVDADGARSLDPAGLGLSYRHSDLRPGQVIAGATLALRPRP